jgi:hypothetical protein
MQALGTTTRREDAIVTNLGTAPGKHMLEEAFEKLDTREGDPLEKVRPIVSVAEDHFSIVDGFDPTVGNGDAKHVAAKVLQDFVPAAGVFGMNHPVFVPDRRGDMFEEAGPF